MTVRELLHREKHDVPVNQNVSPLATFQAEMNKLLNDYFGDMSLPSWFHSGHEAVFAITPAMDVIENDKGFHITAELPGMEAKDVQITAADGYVTIKGEKKQEAKEEHEGYFRRERSYGSFQRVVTLPDTANFDKAEASFKNGVLTLSIPKKASAEAKARKIEIRQVA